MDLAQQTGFARQVAVQIEGIVDLVPRSVGQATALRLAML